MRLIFFTDGSDDGFAAAQLVAALIDPAAVSYIAVVAVTWPQRPSPIWEKANEAHLALDDLHRAMAVIADQCVKRLRAELIRHTDEIEEIVTVGEPAQATLDILHNVRADIGFIAVTSGPHRDHVAAWVVEVTKRAHCAIVVMHGVNE